MTYSFRLRFDMSPKSFLKSSETSLQIHRDQNGREVHLRSRGKDVPISESNRLVIRSAGWESEVAAKSAADRYRDVLTIALARCRVGVDLGDRAATGAFTKLGLKMLEREHGTRMLNDEHGIMVFETDPGPTFVSQKATARVGAPIERFEEAFEDASDRRLQLPDHGRLSYEFFSASFFTDYADARFMLLFMGLEALIQQSSRSEHEVELVEDLCETVRGDAELSQGQRESMLGSLRWLKLESIRQAGRRLVASAQQSDYSGFSAEELFLECYDVRNRLAHGHSPAPSREEVGRLAAPLEVLVAELIQLAATGPRETDDGDVR